MTNIRQFTVAPAEVDDDLSRHPGQVRWRKNAPPDRVLFATDGRGLVLIHDWIGAGVTFYMEDDCLTSTLREELAYHLFPGLWIWEGKVCTSRDYWGECDEWLEGDVRPLDEDEARALRENDILWDRSLWVESEPSVKGQP